MTFLAVTGAVALYVLAAWIVAMALAALAILLTKEGCLASIAVAAVIVKAWLVSRGVGGVLALGFYFGKAFGHD